MMDQRVLDRAIDSTAGQIIGREPSHALSRNVMARVRAGNMSVFGGLGALIADGHVQSNVHNLSP